MDLRLYYQKIRDTEAKIADAFPVVESCETPDGGTSGRLTEVTPALAAKLIVEALTNIPATRDCKCGSALRHALMTAPDRIPAATREKLDLLVGKYLV